MPQSATVDAIDTEVRDLVSSLKGATDFRGQFKVVDKWARRRRVDRLRDAALALVEAWRAAGESEPGVRATFERIATTLALTPTLNHALALREISRHLTAPAGLASRMASRQPLEICAELVATRTSADHELLACLAQELVLRGRDLETEPFRSFWAELAGQAHALTWLPLRLAPIEGTPSLPAYSMAGFVQGTPYGRPESHNRQASAGLAVPPIRADSTSVAEAQRLSLPVATWLENSNGRVEARVFAVAPAEPALALEHVLSSAKLECLAGGPALRCEAIGPGVAFSFLFAAASMGGAYDSGRAGAYGRLCAWRGLGALAGAEAEAAFDDVHECAREARWFYFASDSAWFEGVAWDFGLAAMSGDGSRLAVLAATDSD